jgi:hypothetical protein
MVHGLPDAMRVVFDDERAVANAGVLLPAMLADRLGIEALVDRTVDLGGRAGAAKPGRKVMSLVSAMALGADCIDDCDVLRSGQTRAVLGHAVSAPSTLGTFLRAFTFGHVRQLDRVLADCLARAWTAGAGPGDDRLVVDVDSFVGEVYGYDKQGAGYGYTHKRGYHPIVATRSGTGEVLHIRARKGSANTSRGALRFVEELIPRVARAGASGPKLLRADSGFWNTKIMARLQTAGWTYSIGVRQQPHVKAAIAAIPEQDWQTLEDYPEGGGGADRADDARPPTADRAPHPSGRCAGRVVARLAAFRVLDQPHRRDRTRRSRAPPARRGGTRDPGSQRPGVGALPVREVPRQRRLDRDRRARAQPPQMDHPDRAARHDHPDRPDHPPPAADRSRPGYSHRPDSDTPDADPVAMGDRLPHRPRAPPYRAAAHLRHDCGNEHDRLWTPASACPEHHDRAAATTQLGRRHQRHPIRSTGPSSTPPDPVPTTDQAPATPAAHSERWIEA